MTRIKCLFCGSTNLIADRALSGRLICNSCGNPYGARKVGRIKINKHNSFSFNNKNWLFLLILIVSIIIVVI